MTDLAAPPRWRREPFRVFFPLGVVLAWVGIGHWLLYATGVIATYSCLFHGLLAFAVATHVALGHLGLPALAEGRPPALVVLALAFLLALMARVAADWSGSYFGHLGWAAGSWLVGSAVWLAFLGPRLLRR